MLCLFLFFFAKRVRNKSTEKNSRIKLKVAKFVQGFKIAWIFLSSHSKSFCKAVFVVSPGKNDALPVSQKSGNYAMKSLYC